MVIPPGSASDILLYILKWRPDVVPNSHKYFKEDRLTRVEWENPYKALRALDRLEYLALHVQLVKDLRDKYAKDFTEEDVESYIRALKVSAALIRRHVRGDVNNVSLDFTQDGRILISPTLIKKYKNKIEILDKEALE